MKLTQVILSLLLISIALGLHLHPILFHEETTSAQLRTKVTTVQQKLNELNSSMTKSLESLDPYHIDKRIQVMETSVLSARKSLFQIYQEAKVPLDEKTVYCQPISSQKKAQILTTLQTMNTSIKNMSGTPPLNSTTHPYQQTASELNTILNSIEDTSKTNVTTTSQPPKSVKQTNLAANQKWTYGNTSLSQVAKQYEVGETQNGDTCPTQKPFVNTQNQCVDCSGYYDITTKSCVACSHFDTVKKKCTNAPPKNQTKPTQENKTKPAPAELQVTNTQHPVGLILPNDQTLEQYKAELAKSAQKVIPCSTETPYYDGTKCIKCADGQLFSTKIKTCQTCPGDTIYSKTTYHCQPVQYYSDLQSSSQWISVAKNEQKLTNQMLMNSKKVNAKPCPTHKPFFDGNNCITCSPPTPYFSYDSNKCSNCLNNTVFSRNLHTCVFAQQMQTNLEAPNLLLDGHPFNQWKYYYVNNQTANPQLADCPLVKPYFDGITCVSCREPKSLFSMEHRICTKCADGTKYDEKVRQCLSSSGNIVTQSPTLAKMAAGIFA